jgi:hypothetical protein
MHHWYLDAAQHEQCGVEFQIPGTTIHESYDMFRGLRSTCVRIITHCSNDNNIGDGLARLAQARLLRLHSQLWDRKQGRRRFAV